MSIICAQLDTSTNTLWIGSDQLSSNGSGFIVRAPKFVVVGKWALGAVGDMRTVTLIERHSVKLLSRVRSPHTVVDRIKKMLKDDGYNASDEAGAQEWGSSFILAHPDAVYGICEAFSITKVQAGQFLADGSGWAFATGAAFAASDRSFEERMLLAVSAASAHDKSCGGPPWIHSIAGGK